MYVLNMLRYIKDAITNYVTCGSLYVHVYNSQKGFIVPLDWQSFSELISFCLSS